MIVVDGLALTLSQVAEIIAPIPRFHYTPAQTEDKLLCNLRRSIYQGLLIFLGLLLTSPAPAASTQQTAPSSIGKSDGNLPSLGAIKDCLKEARSAECLDNLFGEALKSHTTAEALQLIQGLEAQDPELRRDCHPVVHAIGRETFRLKGNIHDSFSACNQTCHSGCYHGSVERFLRGDEVYSQTDKHPSQAELKQKAAVACDPNTPMRLRFQCLHGLGHALMFFSRYDLGQSLGACDALPDDWSRNSCYGGVFMENVSNSTNEKKNFSPTEYHVPCNRMDSKYRRECYMMQTSRMSEMGLSTQRLFDECDKAGEYREACTQSVGRDLSNRARVGQPGFAAQECEMAREEIRRACVRGIVYALVDNTWDGHYAMPFCDHLSEEIDQDNCFKESAGYLRTVFGKSNDEIIHDCSRHAAKSRLCHESALQ